MPGPFGNPNDYYYPVDIAAVPEGHLPYSMFFEELYGGSAAQFNSQIGSHNPSVDTAVPEGTAVVAPTSGRVVYAGPVEGDYQGTDAAYTVTILGDDGNYYRMLHVSAEGLIPPYTNGEPTRVTAGQQIAQTAGFPELQGLDPHLDFRVFVPYSDGIDGDHPPVLLDQEGNPSGRHDYYQGTINLAQGQVEGYWVDPFAIWGSNSPEQRGLMLGMSHNPSIGPLLNITEPMNYAEIQRIDEINAIIRQTAMDHLQLLAATQSGWQARAEDPTFLRQIESLDIRFPTSFEWVGSKVYLAHLLPAADERVQNLAAVLESIPSTTVTSQILASTYVQGSRAYLQEHYPPIVETGMAAPSNDTGLSVPGVTLLSTSATHANGFTPDMTPAVGGAGPQLGR
ncbi:peptidoglycan DD-metalloendopeptidase family protein [bacterium]|nr:peptidoglycan DD-metalloendopeptidase family protein [bacterium]